MRRMWIAVLCLFLLVTSVSGANSVSQLQSSTAISADGTCQISMILQLHMDGTESKLLFPLPGNARDITLNGGHAKTSRADSMRWVDLADEIHGAGNYTLTLHYTLPDLVESGEKTGLVLTLPLLSGFSYPIDKLEFSVTLPGETKEIPTFTSTYHPESVESFLEYSVDGPVISGSSLQGIKDHDTLTMTLLVDEALFPQDIAKRWSVSYDDLLQYVLLFVALLYWILFLRCGFVRRSRWVQPPDGITAGEMGCCIGGLGVDMSMLVLSWAQMGYLTMEMNRGKRVRLHKTMDMGNERSNFEVRCFNALFGKRSVVDGSSVHFARLGNKVKKTVPGSGHYMHKHSGNPLIFRGIIALIGAIAGYSLAIAFASDTVWQVLLCILLIPLGAVTSWLIQDGACGIRLRYRLELLIGIGCILLWLLLGAWSGELTVAFFVIFSQLLGGFGAIHGGRRTESGLQVREEALGLRRYLRSVSQAELAQILEQNPDYYFTMIPYAMAMGVDNPFARQFGQIKLGTCPYLHVNERSEMTARQWNELLRQAVRILDERQRKLPWEKLLRRR